ncbi:MAG: S1 RNA-binding domain-containing protein [Anaerolineales bacterium]|jgi:small subunit ribosomal protein S1
MVHDQLSDKDDAIYDDGWWASVLAEEESRTMQTATKSPVPEESSKLLVDWDRAMSLYQQDGIIELSVTGYNRGGLLVEGEELTGFVPCSHLLDLPIQPAEDRREECLAVYVGRKLRLKVIECVPEEARMVFSERAARAEAGKRPALFSTILPGQHISGEVTNITEFGVFVDLGGVEGLIHISELSWGRVAHPGQVCQVGQRVEVQVMEVSPERCRIALSLKRLLPNPWETAQERYPVNAIFPAVITALASFGAFARLEEGLEGLIHSSEIPLTPDKTMKDVLAPGQTVQVRVLQVESSRQRLGLSMKIN